MAADCRHAWEPSVAPYYRCACGTFGQRQTIGGWTRRKVGMIYPVSDRVQQELAASAAEAQSVMSARDGEAECRYNVRTREAGGRAPRLARPR